jgi:molybdate transport system substrate-binding protein
MPRANSISVKRVGAFVLALLAACSSATGARTTTEITVAAAASLSSVFPQIAAGFERAHPSTHVRFTFGASNGLATQIKEGAPVDVFASASPKWLDAVATDPGIAARAAFARNRLIVIVPRDNPAHITRFADIARTGVRLVVAAAGVPAGDYARQAFGRAGLQRALHNVVSSEQDVEGVVQKVVSGDADAGIVYATDVTPVVARAVTRIELPASADVVAVYEIGVIRGTKVASVAREFMTYVLGPGQAVLIEAGFSPPA